MSKKITALGLDIDVLSIYDDSSYHKSEATKTIRVFHPHGFLPKGDDFSKFALIPIVFSEDDYHHHYFDYTYWANLVQLSVFRTSLCLFIGLSFSDGNMRRLFDFVGAISKSNHVAIMLYDKATLSPTTTHIENFISYRDLLSLGVGTLWAERKEDIPSIIRMIKS